ncbi:MAG: metallophosphoesterase [Myxococcota bacterium]|nr:metallophosphoesterase [Myxococcota bacterium]
MGGYSQSVSQPSIPPFFVFLFAVLVLSVAAGLYAYVGWGLGIGHERDAWVYWGLGLQFASLPWVFVLSRYGRRNRWVVGLYWCAYLGLGLVWLLSLGFLVRDALVWILAESGGSFYWVTGVGAGQSTLLVAVTVVLLGMRGVYNVSHTPKVRRTSIECLALAPGLEGFRVVQITDLHVGQTLGAEWLKGVVASVNAQDPDIVVITGDLVEGVVGEIGGLVSGLADLHARHGVFFVTGNHEYYYGAAAWMAEVERLGIEVLLNTHTVIERGNARLLVAGVADWDAARFSPEQASDPVGALQGAPAVDFKLLLAHQPRTAPVASKAGYDLQISGHTHGGQIFPFHLLVPMQQPFRQGLHRVGGMQIYVSRGTGYWGPPIRLGAPAEISVLELTRV